MEENTQPAAADSQGDGGDLSILSYLQFSVHTDVGKKREENQDSYGILEREDLTIYIVADGMGGVKGGAIASQLAIKTFEESLNGDISPESYVAAVQKANLTVFQKGQEDAEFAGMGTTFIALCFSGIELHVLHVGDSRAYRFRDDAVRQITRDHSLVQELVDSGALSEEQAEDHPVSHMLTRSLGPAEDVIPDCLHIVDGPIAGDRYLLCSDGLYNLVSTAELPGLIKGKSDKEAVQLLVDLANERGGTDNITVLIVTIADEYPVTEVAMSEDSHSENGASPAVASSVSLEEKAVERLEEEGSSTDSSEDEALEEKIDSSLDRERKKRTGHLVIGAMGFFAIVAFVVLRPQLPPLSLEPVEEEEVATVIAEPVVPAPISTVKSKPQPVAQEQKPENNKPEAVELKFNLAELLEDIKKDKANIHAQTTQAALDNREKYLSARAETFQEHVRLLSSPLSGSLGEILRRVPRERKKKGKELRSLRSEIDIATRRLATWYGRKSRMEGEDPISLSVEVAATSTAVQQAKKNFDGITWEYLKAAEVFQYDPKNRELQRKLFDLRKRRQQELSALGKTIQGAISEEIQSSDEEITVLTLKRNRIEEELRNLDRDEKIARVITSGTKEARAALLKQLTEELATIQSELSELHTLSLEAQNGGDVETSEDSPAIDSSQ